MEYKNYIKNSILHTDFVNADKEKYIMMVDEITESAIKEYNIKPDKYGITYYVVKNMVYNLMACLLDNEEGELTLEWFYIKI